jgi:light-regulated signal transduction histidine kinase (bacteriophytochrome)
MLHMDGSPLDVEVAAASLLLEGRIMVLVEIRDVSREVAAQKALQGLNRDLEARIAERTAALTAANRDLQTANHDLESFSYSVAHDLRAPLRNMIGFANLLKIDIDEQNLSAAPTHADRVVAGAERMNDLIDGLLAVSRVSHGALEDGRVDFAALLAEIVADAAPEARVRLDIGRLPVVNCDASTMRQVWTNLVSNALKYSAKRDEPRVIIAGRPAGDEYVFDVQDNGAGFDPAYAERLFGVFQRLHSSREFEGNGVGLAIVRRIVERHGGRVWAEGSPGAGATFHFSLPIRRIIDTRQS